MAAVVQEAMYLIALMQDFGCLTKIPTDIGEDNQSRIKMCHNLVMHKRSKHIDTKLYFIRTLISSEFHTNPYPNPTRNPDPNLTLWPTPPTFRGKLS